MSLFSLLVLPLVPPSVCLSVFDCLAQPSGGLPATCIIPQCQPFSLPLAKLVLPFSQSLSLRTLLGSESLSRTPSSLILTGALGKALGGFEQATLKRVYWEFGGIISRGWVSAPISMESWTSGLASPILEFFTYKTRLLIPPHRALRR